MIKNLAEAFGISGLETEVRKQVKTMLCESEIETTSDTMGNLIAKSPHREGKPTVILTAYMDESGFIVTDITSDGYLKFDIVGNLDINSLLSQRVKFGDLTGLISFKAVHLTTKEEREKPIKIESLLIDIGTNSKSEAEEVVSVGDYGVFDTTYAEVGKGFIKGRSLGGRVGVATLVDILKDWKAYDINLMGVFTVQRQIMSRGMALVAGSLPDSELAIVLDSVEATPKRDAPILCERGAAISFVGDMPDTYRKIAEDACLAAQEEGVLYQRFANTERTDADRLVTKGPDAPVLLLGIPCRYKNTGVNIVSLSDIESTRKLVDLVLRRIANGSFK